MFEKNMMFYLCKMQQNNLLQQKLQSNLQDKKLLFANVKSSKNSLLKLYAIFYFELKIC